MRMSSAYGVGTILLALVFTGCAGSGGGGGPSGPPPCKSKVPGCVPQQPETCTPVSFGSNVQPIFDRSCALSGCHPSAGAVLNYSLARGDSYKQSVRVASLQQPGLKRVAPGDPTKSYLYLKITGDPSISGVLMPQGCPGTPAGGAQCLSSDEIDAINTWILECAPNN